MVCVWRGFPAQARNKQADASGGDLADVREAAQGSYTSQQNRAGRETTSRAQEHSRSRSGWRLRERAPRTAAGLGAGAWPPGRSLRVTLPRGGPSHLPELCRGPTPALATPREGVGYLWPKRRPLGPGGCVSGAQGCRSREQQPLTALGLDVRVHPTLDVQTAFGTGFPECPALLRSGKVGAGGVGCVAESPGVGRGLLHQAYAPRPRPLGGAQEPAFL